MSTSSSDSRSKPRLKVTARKDSGTPRRSSSSRRHPSQDPQERSSMTSLLSASSSTGTGSSTTLASTESKQQAQAMMKRKKKMEKHKLLQMMLQEQGGADDDMPNKQEQDADAAAQERQRRFHGSFVEEEGISNTGWTYAFFGGLSGEQQQQGVEAKSSPPRQERRSSSKKSAKAATTTDSTSSSSRTTDAASASTKSSPSSSRTTAAASVSTSPRASPAKSLNRGGAARPVDVKVNSRLSQRSQRLLATYYERTEFVDSRSGTDECANGEDGSDGGGRAAAATSSGSLIHDTKAQMLRLQSSSDDEKSDSSSEEKQEGKDGSRPLLLLPLDDGSRGVTKDDEVGVQPPPKSGLAHFASRAASMVDELSSKTRFSSERETTRVDIADMSSQRGRQRRRWQRFSEPGAVQMRGRAYGAPPRPPDAKPTRVRGLTKSEVKDDECLLLEGVVVTSDGPLIQAKAVDEDECAPRALIENDVTLVKSTPLAMKHLFVERSVRLRLCGLCFLIALLTMAVSVVATHYGKGAYDDDTETAAPATTPSLSPTYINEALVDDLVPISGLEALSTPSSPQRRAVGWLSSIDKSGLDPSDSFFIQRYVVVLLYFSMGGENWMAQDKWLDPNLHECEWSPSIHCKQDHSGRPCVTGIDLSRMGLEGTIPREIGHLRDVESINLSRNTLKGTIPPEIFDIDALNALVVNSNMLTSTIPSSVSNTSFLDYLDLSSNLLEGPIPDEMYDLTRLRTLVLSSNELTGTISGRMENLKVLYTLDLRTNLLSGTIPDAISFLSHLAFVRLDENRLGGSFPSVTTAFVQLEEFTVSHNFLSGTIPSFPLGGMEVYQGFSDNDFRLERLNIAHNGFEGLIPEFVGRIPSLREFYFAGNAFGGTYPTMPGMWRSLEVVVGGMNQLTGIPPTSFPPTLTQYDFHANFFSGGVPSELFDMFPRIEYLSLANNPLGGQIPSSFENMPHLVGLDLRECNLKGRIPELRSLGSLASFDIQKNEISGTLPTELGDVFALTSLKLASNRLTGSICAELGNLSSLSVLLLEDNALTGSLPDTLANLGDLVDFRVADNPLQGSVPEEICIIVKSLSVDHVGCDLLCDCCVDEDICGAS